MEYSILADNIARISERIETRTQRCGREPGSVGLLAVSKKVSSERILQAYECGISKFGENYIQEAISKQSDPALAELPIEWNFIGHLQSNKVREAAGRFERIQSVDSTSLATEIGKRSAQNGLQAQILIEFKLDRAETKFGFDLERAEEVIDEIGSISGIALCGLMGMAPYSTDPEAARPHFRRLKQIFDRLPDENRKTLSMGMTGDFETAIEEGTTQVRIGTAIFGSRT